MINSCDLTQLESELGLLIELQLGGFFAEESIDHGLSRLDSDTSVTCLDSSAWD